MNNQLDFINLNYKFISLINQYLITCLNSLLPIYQKIVWERELNLEEGRLITINLINWKLLKSWLLIIEFKAYTPILTHLTLRIEND